MDSARVLGEMLPAGVAAVESFGDPEPAPLYPEEEARVAGAVAKRRLEFAAVRSAPETRCASSACRRPRSCQEREARPAGLRASSAA
jgi:hypothetical protein